MSPYIKINLIIWKGAFFSLNIKFIAFRHPVISVEGFYVAVN